MRKLSEMLKRIPNILSLLRLLAAAILIFAVPFSALFYILYCFCGISDIADGFLARRLNAESDFGAKLDSLADFVFVVICIAKLWRFLAVPLWIWLWIAIIGIIKIISMLTIRIKNGKLDCYHTFLNRLTGFLLFVSAPFVCMRKFWIFAALLCIIATCAAVEEIIINLRD